MPRKALKPCRYGNCPRLTEGTYCEEHAALMAKRYDESRSKSHNKKYGTQWHKIRNRYARAHPLCERCLSKGKYTPMEEVHHIIPVNCGGSNDDSNLMSLCRSCHEQMHIELGDRKPKYHR